MRTNQVMTALVLVLVLVLVLALALALVPIVQRSGGAIAKQ